MKLHYDKNKNFGDELNGWLWPQLIPDLLDDNADILFVGIGSLLNSKLPERPFKVVFGSGVATSKTGREYGKRLPTINSNWKIYCVRGPLSAKALGLPDALAITDSAALLRVTNLPQQPKLHPVSFIPHILSARFWDWKSICRDANINYIHPEQEISQVLSTIQQSHLVITEAMHGAIIADALRVPWIGVKAYKHIHTFKWQDWCLSMSLDYHPVSLPSLYTSASITDRVGSYLRMLRLRNNPFSQLYLQVVEKSVQRSNRTFNERVAHQATAFLAGAAASIQPQLSTDAAVQQVTAQLEQKLADLRADVVSGHLADLVSAAQSTSPGVAQAPLHDPQRSALTDSEIPAGQPAYRP